MSEPGGFDYLDSVSKDAGSKPVQNSNLQTKQTGLDPAPSEGGEGFVGGNPNASAVGFDYVTGKKGYSEDRSVWNEKSSGGPQASGADTATPGVDSAKSDPTDEKATYKHVQDDEGLPQTWRSSFGAGDAGPSNSDEPDKEGLLDGIGDGGGKPDTQHAPSSSVGEHEMGAMPQTEFTGIEGGGAPSFKHRG